MEYKRSSKDMISTLPQTIIETILCLVPIREAGRTSILSREWRYRWTKIPKLMFVQDMCGYPTGKDQLYIMEQTLDKKSQGSWMIDRCKFLYAIYQVLVLHQGPISDFTLDMDIDSDFVEIDQIILHLLRRKTLKKLTLALLGDGGHKLPLSIFSLHQLTHLHLHSCEIKYQPTFSGFRSLTTLYLKNVDISVKMLPQLLFTSPLLEKVTLIGLFHGNDTHTLEDYSDISLEHLNKLKIIYFSCSEFKFEFELVKLILIKSPVLKKVTLLFGEDAQDKMSEGSRILSVSPRASPVAEIIVDLIAFMK